MSATHEVLNQAPPLTGFTTADDPALLEALRRDGAAGAEAEVRELGARAGSPEAQEWARTAEAHPPVAHTHDRYGHRVDEVEFHPSWHRLMTVAVESGQHAAPWAEGGPGAHLARAAKFYVWAQAEPGHGCPVSMTYAAVPALRAEPALAAAYEPLLAARSYDFGLRPPLGKRGLIAGMSMTEKQGGSDVRANTTTAVPAGDGSYVITGHKWFTSAPMSDVFLVLAQAPEGLTCFLMPRVLPDGTRNAMRIQRLKDKLGNRSNASAEIEYERAVAWPVGEPGRGVRTIVEMVNMTRLDCVIGSAAGMRAGLRQALHHTAHRRAFGAELIDQPLMRNVLADLAVESEAATVLAMRLAAALDRSEAGDAGEAALRRLALAAGKYWVCKRGSAHAAEALECLGGNGYVEDSGMPRLYREAPLLSIWEGSGNVAALDVLRALGREPAALAAYFAEVDAAAGADARLDAAAARLRRLLGELTDPGRAQLLARRVAEQLTLVLQGSLLVRHSTPAVADAFCASRLDADWGNAFGTLPAGTDLGAVLERARAKDAR
ncbi:acyl-CoA dehydrogenase family protein [Streptomyces albireticuli]|uniref:DNA alkylation response protein n=1 Tax=Streptomyces albireticuli TaxID=1940 RepID=A0A2A2DH56_9ACTN|nr:acyl-CoA dehydrogenase family protein [Streptomyces albireticuli]MCD9141172.1 acyl-CoA dehydrogenase family protein [Streptomyces albireticuli]MCD9160867.1 acyl-CoA dehydrogenase family protein [Streptomyces albireticuli]MCD9191076.1 acyl-CoA dehydrogenase family protein [Streptomyces albireticuli]PAU50841.1 DNA alkylation response protein [Streptomyces albireticuli]